VDHLTYCDLLEVEAGRLVALATNADVSAPVPSCPDWTVGDLTEHVGLVYRRVEYWVRVLAPTRISMSEMNLTRAPATAAWLAEGGELVVGRLRASDPDAAMWAWGEDQHVRFWSRRLVHETLVHRLDLELALGLPSEVDDPVATDAIDEFLHNVARSGNFSSDVKNLVGDDEVLRFACAHGPTWHIRLHREGFEFVDSAERVDAVLAGPALALLEVLYRRRDLESSPCTVTGRRELVERWVANSALR